MTEWIPLNELGTDPTTTLSADLLSGGTSLSVADTSKMPTAGYVGRGVCGSEIVLITGGAGNPYTVARAQEGTTQADHHSGDAFNIEVTAAGLQAIIQRVAEADANLVQTTDSRLSDQRTPLDNSVTSAKILDGTIVNADIAAGAAIALSKVSGAAQDSLVVHLAGAETLTGAKIGPNGSAAAATWAARAAGNGIYSAATGELDLASNGTQAASISSSVFTVSSTRKLLPAGGIQISNRFEISVYFPLASVPSSPPSLVTDLLVGSTSFTVDDATLFQNSGTPRGMFINNAEWVVATNVAGNVVTCVRGRFGTTEIDHFAGETLMDVDPSTNYNNFVIPTTGSPVNDLAEQPLNGNVSIYLPPTISVGTWTSPAGRYFYTTTFKDMNGFTATFKDGYAGATVTTLVGGASPSKRTIEFQIDTTAHVYVPIAVY